MLNPLYHNSNCSILNARLNIYDYPRQVHIPILWKDISLPLTINWGEVICLVRFTQYNNPYVKINLKEILNPNEVVPNYVKNFNIFSRFKINFFKLLPQLRKLRKKKMMKL